MGSLVAQILDTLRLRLVKSEVPENAVVLLVGWASETMVQLVDCLFLPTDSTPASLAAVTDAMDLLPVGLSYVGVYAPTLPAAETAAVLPAVQALMQPDSPALLLFNEAGNLCFRSQLQPTNSNKALRVGPAGVGAVAWLTAQQQVAIRCSFTAYIRIALPSLNTTNSTDAGFSAALTTAFASVERELSHKNLVYLAQCPHSNGSCSRLLLSRDTPGDLAQMLQHTKRHPSSTNTPFASATTSSDAPDSPAPTGPPGTTFSSSSQDMIHATPLVQTSPSARASLSSSEPTPACSPLYTYRAAVGGACPTEICALRMDVLCYVRVDSAATGVGPDVLRPALLRQLKAMQALMEKEGRAMQVHAYHFLPPGRSHHVTALYPALSPNEETSESLLVPTRRRLHYLLGLPDNQPLMRSANALECPVGFAPGTGGGLAVGLLGGKKAATSTAGATARLRDVHAGLTAPGLGKSSLVSGSYEYYHYMQDRLNDCGWGCAYRSLQTLCSWFQLQQYTRKPVPSHREIQQVLVKLGDKPGTFVGSSQWIGAIEVGYVLDELLGVTCKVVAVSKGADIPSYARQLSAHFQEHGTPIMIGGGVLAYTLLGVDFDEVSGNAAFLILDPHYTGGDDLRKVQQGSWVAWKRLGDTAAAGGPLFVPEAFYNFLCPQRPNSI